MSVHMPERSEDISYSAPQLPGLGESLARCITDTSVRCKGVARSAWAMSGVEDQGAESIGQLGD